MEMHKSQAIFGGLSVKTGKVITYICDRQTGAAATLFLNKVKAFKNTQYPGNSLPLLLIWDNVSSHKSKEVKQWLQDNPGIVELHNFPPYSPEYNPIEHVWKELKKHINHLRGTATLDEIMTRVKSYFRQKKFFYKLLGCTKESIF